MSAKNLPNTQLSIVIPCYREEKNIIRHLNNIRTQLLSAKEKVCFEIIAVNDGSPDNTLAELHKAAQIIPELKVVSYEVNKGKGNAVREGVLQAQGDYVCFIDADGEIPYKQIIKYYCFAKHGEVDIVIGSKAHPLSNAKFSFFRQVISLGYRMINKVLFKLPVSDTQVGIKLFSKKVAQTIFPHMETLGYAFDVEFLGLAKLCKFTIFEAPVEILHSQNSSSVTLRTIFKVFFDTLKVRMKIKKTLLSIRTPQIEGDVLRYAAN